MRVVALVLLVACGEEVKPQYLCSGDLRNVIDQGGTVIETCPDDQACGGGACVPACVAPTKGKGSVGCDFQVATPSFYPKITSPCFAVFIANNWPKDVKVGVSRGAQSFDATMFGRIADPSSSAASWAAIPANGIPPGQVGVLFVSSDPGSMSATPLTCPIAPALNASSAVNSTDANGDATDRGTAWHITTSYPVEAYDIIPYGGATSYLPSAELLFPTTAWSTNYVAVVPTRGMATAAGSEPQWAQVVAAEDGTLVTIFPTVGLPSGGGVAAAPARTPTTFTLDAGELFQWQDTNEMSGSIINATKPIAFSGGHSYACYKSATATNGGGCDSAHQQMAPLSAWGSEYAVPAYTTRLASLEDESIPYRFVGSVAGTTLTYDPPVPTAPQTLGVGQVVDFETTGSFVVTSQDAAHPFYIGQVMSGCLVDGGSRPGCGGGAMGGSCCLGDEEYVNIPPPAQFLTKYVFFTDPTYPTTNLVFTREKTSTGFRDVTLDCLGPVTGWKPYGTSGRYEITNVDLIRDDVKNGNCNNGPHVADSTAPFGLMVWGLAQYASYAYPAGANVAPINSVVANPN